MAASQTTSSTFDQLKSAEQSELMDAIDKLRSHGLNNELDLPQLVVCGSQSSGKSSVLEAIAQVTFPAGEGTKTRFASELVLRHAKYELRKVSLRAAPDTSPAEAEYLDEFQPEFAKAEDFPNILDQAAVHLEKVQGGRTFSKHHLRVELSGPDKPHLTLVDLPGLIANARDEQDVQHVQQIVEPYLQESRSIILAVMPAVDDHYNHPVFRMIRKHDADGLRTLGILTKPDRLERGSEKEKMAVDMVLGNSIDNDSLALGWHVLRNRDHANKGATHQDRDHLEQQFFDDSDSLWSEAPTQRRGVAALRARLRDLLFGVISQSLPTLTQEIQKKIDACEARITLLGEPRPDEIRQRRFLDLITTRLDALVKQAVKAEYDDNIFFRSCSTQEGQQKRLRTEIENLSDGFKANMEAAELYCVTDNTSWCQKHMRTVRDNDFVLDQNGEQPFCVSERAMVRAIERHMAEHRSKILTGEYSNRAITDVFKIQIKRWERIAERYVKDCISTSATFMVLALKAAADDSTRQKVWKHIIEDKFQECREQTARKVAELLTPFNGMPATTKNPSFVMDRDSRDTAARDATGLASSRVLYRVLSYY